LPLSPLPWRRRDTAVRKVVNPINPLAPSMPNQSRDSYGAVVPAADAFDRQPLTYVRGSVWRVTVGARRSRLPSKPEKKQLGRRLTRMNADSGPLFESAFIGVHPRPDFFRPSHGRSASHD
jgi:hypothetical protein